MTDAQKQKIKIFMSSLEQSIKRAVQQVGKGGNVVVEIKASKAWFSKTDYSDYLTLDLDIY